jgi:hypothetical protein
MHIDDVDMKLKFIVSLQIPIYNVDEKPNKKKIALKIVPLNLNITVASLYMTSMTRSW